MFLGPPDLQIFGAAGDKDQAKLLRDDVVGKCDRNPALRRLVKITEHEITVPATKTRFRHLSADAPSSYGLRPDRIYIDELAEWTRRDLWDSLWSASGKRPGCRVTVITTAGWDKTSIAWEVRQIAQAEPDWYFSSRGQCASWIRPAWLAQQRRTLPPHVYARLHECRWVDGVGAWLSSEQVDACFGAVPASDDGLVGQGALGLDLGIARDCGVLARVERVGGLVVVRNFLTYTPTQRSRVDLSEVEADVETLALRHGCPVVYDPYQAVGMAQRLAARGVRMIEYSFSGDGRRKLFATLLDLVTRGGLRAEPHAVFRRELLGLEAKESASGWRVDHRPGQHDDHVVAVGLAVAGLPAATGGDPSLILLGGPRTVANARLLEAVGPAGVIATWDERSVARHEGRERGPGGGRNGSGGLII
jgi:hypothetical protein